MSQINEQKLRVIEFLFRSMQTEFNIYNNLHYSQEYRFAAHDKADAFIQRLANEFGLYYTIHDEDDEHSFIRPDCYNDKYKHLYQKTIEQRLNLKYDIGEE